MSLSSGAIRFGQIILDATICNRLSPKNMRKLRISWTGSDASRERGCRERGQAYSPPLKIKSALTPCSPNYRKACTALWHRAWLYILCLLSHIRHFLAACPVAGTLMNNNRLMIFTGNANPELARAVAGILDLPIGKAAVNRFSDGEVRVEIQENVRGKEVFVLQSTSAPANDH